MKKTRKLMVLLLIVILMSTFVFAACDAPAAAESDVADEQAADAVAEISEETEAEDDAGEEVAQAETDETTSDGDQSFKVGFANSSLDNPWRIGIQNAIEKNFERYPEVELITNQADEDPITLNDNIEDMITQGVDLILCCTVESEPFEVSAKLCEEEGVPLILVDRGITSGTYTSFIQQSNYQIGYDAADWAAEQMEERYGEQKGKIVELQGVPGNLPAEERRISFHEQVEENYPDLEIVAAQPTDYSRADALEVMENILQAQDEIDVVYTHEDEIALGAIKALEESDRLEGVLVIGNGGSINGVEAVQEGKMAACMTYSPIDFGYVAVETAMKFLHGGEIDKEIEFQGGIITSENVEKYMEQMKESGEDFVQTIEG